MNAQELRDVVGQAMRDPANFPWLQWVLALLILAITVSITVYLMEKARNAATKEDIEKITRDIESVRHEYQAQLERIKGTVQVRSAALSTRLQAHQGAYSVWAKIVQALYEGRATDSLEREAHQWWIDNSLYLSPSARSAFREALDAATVLRLLTASAPSDRADVVKKTEVLHAAGKAIIEGVELPEIDELRFVRGMQPEIGKTKTD
jgi:hypothetical protein